MYDTLTAINLNSAATSADLPSELKDQLFEMSTCQRKLLVGLGVWPDKALAFFNDQGIHGLAVYHGSEAYQYLLEVITGLKSRLLGESEVAGQFKKAYDTYKSSSNFNSVCGQILEKLMKDGKEIKTKYLQSIGQYSYAGLAKRVLQKSAGMPILPAQAAQRAEGQEAIRQNHAVSGQVLIVGTGQLVQDTAMLLGKHYELSFTGRNPEKMEAICKQFKGRAVVWPLDFKKASGLEHFSAIINTIGAEEILFEASFFERWNNKTFVDLGRPSVIQTSRGMSEGVYRLADLLTLGQRFDETKLVQVQKALSAIEQLTQKRVFGACSSFPFGWEELQFA